MHIIKTALLSYGMSGKVFHAPFIDHHPGFQLVGSWERSQRKIQEDYPQVTSYPTLEALLADESIELVIINTPTNTHFDYATRALLANKNVVVEKAFTSSVEEGRSLRALAGKQKKKISVYQNRRYDSDFRTVQKILISKILGPLVEVEFHYDRYKPIIGPKLHKETAGPGAGLLMDLGPHLIDAALCLFGMPVAVFADIRITRPLSKVDDYFDLLLYYPDFRVRLKASSFAKEAIPANIIHGHKGSFIKTRADVQENDLLAGKKPGKGAWGVEPTAEQGVLHTEKDGVDVRENIISEIGNYGDYYEGVYQALTSEKPVPVSADDGINTIIVIEAAVESSAEKRVVEITSS
jgi:predicted dehydrogenase